MADKLKNGYFIYFISNNQGNIKIGKTNNIPKRLSQIQNGNANKLSLVCVLPVDTKQKMDELEKDFHEIFKNNRINGEWFEERPVINFLNLCKFTLDRMKFDMEEGD